MELRLVLTTEADRDKANDLASHLLEQRLAACIALQDQDSLYHWKGTIARDSEVQLLIKTSAELLPQLEVELHRRHSYEVPEWIVLPATTSEAYGLWLHGSLSPPGPAQEGAPAQAS